MSMPFSRGAEDPRSAVDEPLRAALGRLVLESTAAFALVALVVVCPAILALDGVVCDALHASGPILLTAWVAASWLRRTMRPHPDVPGLVAWERARRADPREATLALAIAAASTIAVGFSFILIVRFYALEPAMRATAITAILPALIALYLAVVATGAHNTTDRLARATGESDSRFRAYWRGVAERSGDSR